MYNNCNCNKICPCRITPIVCPEKVEYVHCNYCYEQPVVVPVRTHVVNHWMPRYVYQVQRTTSEEAICHGQAPINNTQGLR